MTPLLVRIISLERPVKRLIQVALDVLLIVLCFAGAMALRLESLSFAWQPKVWAVLFPVGSLTIVAFVKLGLYRAIIRYITARALKVVLLGVGLSAAVMALSIALFDLPIPWAVPAIYAVLLFVAVGGIRFAARSMFMRDKVRQKTPLLIYGAGEAGRQMAHVLAQGPEYDPVAFIDDDPSLQGSTVGGLLVLPPTALKKLVRDLKARAILLAMPRLGQARRRAIMKMVEPFGLEVKSLPPHFEVLRGRAGWRDLRPVTPEDLLGRDPIAPREDLMAANVAGKSVMVTGAGGSIGSELCRQVLERRPRVLVLLDVSEYALYQIEEELRLLQAAGTSAGTVLAPILGSVQNPGRIAAILRAHGVETLYHAAAYKHVPLVEDNVVEGVRNNVFGTRTVAQAAAATGVRSFILVSTDKAVRPTNVMGATKRLAELVCQAMARAGTGTTYSMVRFGNVLDSSGSVIPRFREQIERGGPVTVTHREVSRYFMTIPEAAQLVIQAGAMARGGDVFLLDMGEPVKIFDLARSMIRLHGLEPYVIEDGAEAAAPKGDIGIRITGLRKGEKLAEELLIGADAAGTDHPRILTAAEAAVDPAELDRLLDRLWAACLDYDVPAIRAILQAPEIGYRPDEAAAADPAAPRLREAPPDLSVPATAAVGRPALRVVDGA